MNIVTDNPTTDELELTYLTKSYAQGVTTFSVKNTSGFIAGQKVLVGSMGRERSEVLTIAGSGLTNTAFQTTAASKFPHDADDPIRVLEYDQIKVYRSTTGIAGSYSMLDTIGIDVDNADNKTYYDDPVALPSYYYKIAFYDSVDAVESDQTDPISAGGYTRKQLGRFIPSVAKDVGDPDFIETDIDQWIEWCNDIGDDLITRAKRPYRFLKDDIDINILATESSFPLPNTLWKIDYIQVHEYGAASERIWRPREFASLTAIQSQLALTGFGADFVDAVSFDDVNDTIVFSPKARVDRIKAFTVHFYTGFTELKSLSDTVQTPNALVYKLGLKYLHYMAKADSDSKYLTKAKDLKNEYEAEIMKLQREKNIFASGPSGMKPDAKRYPQFGGRRYRQ